MRALVTGACGFIGSHACDFLLSRGYEVFAGVYAERGTKNIDHVTDKLEVIEWDITKEDDVNNVVARSKPHLVVHMAAQSYVLPSWDDPARTFDTNVNGSYHLLEAIRRLGVDTTTVMACSSAEYGFSNEEELPVSELKEFRPSSPYGISKIGTDMVSYLFWKAYGMNIIRARLFNITGPRKVGDAVSDFVKGVVDVEEGRTSKLRVGNLGARRDITDVRDCLEALWTLKEKATPGEAYNICSNKSHLMEDIVNAIKAKAKKEIVVEVDPARIRRTDEPIFLGSNEKLRKLGWQPQRSLDETLDGVLAYWRSPS
ncbi:MAG: hypothetical protein A2289_19445 [Deltaproteobacteria bacterium RIFOXYA12_FULL_58_15]|nr:MAG: hypothetical protein A2289_19445 [Deltaproteobacteria bacterium RIFOXYA12_FULL_58_15]OGR13913.1 MAG: hypothetical protein A2341_04335 [Deltaproteobacteria bacterium RIFOXYB12_FULL_58_9]